MSWKIKGEKEVGCHERRIVEVGRKRPPCEEKWGGGELGMQCNAMQQAQVGENEEEKSERILSEEIQGSCKAN